MLKYFITSIICAIYCNLCFAQINVVDDTTICSGDQIFLQGAFQNTTGTYYDTIPCSGLNCDTIVTTNLSVASTNPILTTVIECAPYTHVLPDGTLVSISGVYTVPLLSSAGCQFDYITTLIINEPIRDTIFDTICNNEVYTLANGIIVNSPGEHIATTLTLDGCIHYHTVYLTVLPSYTETIDTVFCSNSLYILPNGLPAFNSGTYTHVFSASNGCDSIIITNLIYEAPQIITINDTVCENNTYVLPDNSLATTTGIYTFNYSSINGCDSTLVINLTMLPLYSDTIPAGICNGTPYTFPDGTSTLITGYYPYTFSSIYGCDSIVVFNVLVSLASYDTISVTICNGQSYLMPDNSTINSAGQYTVVITATNGCDSSVTVNLSLINYGNTVIDTVVCSGTIYILPNGFPALFSGNYTYTIQSSTGCDSTIITNLTFQPPQSSSYSSVICEGDYHTMSDGTIFSNQGSHSIILNTIHGCDSTVTVHLTVNPSYNDTINAGICGGTPYLLPDGTSTIVPGTYSYTDTTIEGCDSLYTIVLQLGVPYSNTINPIICEGNLYTLPNGTLVGIGGTYIDTILATNGCDSILTIQLSINQVDTIIVDTVVCAGTIYILPNGFPAFFGGNYTHTVTSVTGCDSVIITNLYYQPSQTTNMNVSICSNENYIMPDGSIVNTIGIHSATINSIYGCDSTINVNLFILPSHVDTINEIICDNEWYYLSSGDSINQVGLYNDSLTTTNGCDSILIINLVVLNSSSATYNVTICFGDSIELINGNFVSIAGIYYDTLISQNGCNAIITTNLTVFHNANDTIIKFICPGSSYTLANGQTVVSPNFYPVVINSNSGCDSILTIDLRFSSGTGISTIDTVNISECNGSSYVLPNGTIVSNSGQYQSTFNTATTCDSIIITNLIILDEVIVGGDTVVCPGQGIVLQNGSVVNNAGIYYDTLTSILGCDSIVVINLNIGAIDTTVLTPIVCDTNYYLLPDGTTATHSGLYTFLYNNIYGCDSIVEVDLLIGNSTHDTVYTTICNNEYYELPNGWLVNIESEYTFTYTNSIGCDSVITFSLSVIPISENIVNVSICTGSYLLPGGYLATSNGVYFDTLSSMQGCDSVIITNLIFEIIDTTFLQASICNNANYLLPDGTVTTSSGIYTINLISSLGCDSIIIVDLLTNTSTIDTIYASICTGFYTLPNGNVVSNSGIYQDTLQSAGGCDSIIITNLNGGISSSDTIYAVICQNDYYILPNGWLVNLPNSYTFTYLNSTGCDSIIIINLSVIQTSEQLINISTCNNVYVLPNGTNTSISGMYYDTLSNSSGCDSIIITNLMFQTIDTVYLYATICHHSSFVLPNDTIVDTSGVYVSNLISINGCDSIVITTIDNFLPSINNIYLTLCSNEVYVLPDARIVDSTGIYNCILFNQNGCDSTLIYHIVFQDKIETKVYAEICKNEYYEMPNGWLVNLPGNYQVILPSIIGCDSIIITELVVSDFSINYIPLVDVLMCRENIKPIVVDYNGYNYQWSNGDIGNTLNFSNPGSYYVNFQSLENECLASDTINITIDESCEECMIYVPNVFTPDDDLYNDIFKATYDCDQGFLDYNFMIYDRWGQLLFQTNNPDIGWDGKKRGISVPIGTYVYIITYKENGKADASQKRGYITVLR